MACHLRTICATQKNWLESSDHLQKLRRTHAAKAHYRYVLVLYRVRAHDLQNIIRRYPQYILNVSMLLCWRGEGGGGKRRRRVDNSIKMRKMELTSRNQP